MNTREFNWSLIPSFLAAMEQGSLMGAARATGVSQPTLGRHIAELEQQLQMVLFERTGRGLQPTSQAITLAEAASAMQVGAASVSRLASGAGQAIKGKVRLTASQPVACFLLPPILVQMRQALPDVLVELVVSNSISNLLMREADIALRMVRPEQGSLVAKQIGQVRLRACASLNYLQRMGTPQYASDLMHHDLIAGNRTAEIEAGFEALGLSAHNLRYGLCTDDLNAQWAGVKAGLGIGFVGEYLALNEPGIASVLPSLALPALPVWLTVHRELRTSMLIRSVYDFLSEHVAQGLIDKGKD